MIARSTFVAVVLFALPLIAVAQPEPADEPSPTDEGEVTAPSSPEEQAAVAFDQGKRAFLEDDYERALAAFEEAQRLAPHDVVRFNIGLCLERLGRFRRAWEEYRHAAQSTQLDETTRADAAERADRVHARLGTVSLPGPAGTPVEVVDVEQCTAPCRVLVDPGRYEIRRVEDPSDTRTVSVARGAEEVVDLTPPEETPIESPFTGLHLKIGIVGWIGAGAVAVGTLGAFAFGIRALGLHDRYLDDPTPALRDSGRTAVVMTNVSIVLAVLGAAAFALDVLVLQKRQETADAPAAGEALALAF